jgi:superfamily II DNA or RNA helicase
MIRKGYLARPVIILFRFDDGEGDYGHYADAYKLGIVHNDVRNDLITQVAVNLFDYGLSTVVFFREVEHGGTIEGNLRTMGLQPPRSVLATGKESGSVRRRILKGFRNGATRVLLCTRIFNEGIDFPEGNAAIKAGGLKYEGTSVQQLGRLLRKVPVNGREIDMNREEKVFFVDIMDLGDEYLAKHSLERFNTYSKEEEFIVEIVDDERGFRKVLDKYRKDVIFVGSSLSRDN